MVGGIATIAAAVEEDMRARLSRQHKKQREGLALLVATMLDVRSANRRGPRSGRARSGVA